jgi:hypothetical protein
MSALPALFCRTWLSARSGAPLLATLIVADLIVADLIVADLIVERA